MNTPAPLVGLAIGDALGMPFETRPSTDSLLQSWDGWGYGSSEYHGLGPGQWTDDTQMSCALAESILSLGYFDADHTANQYLKWYLSGDCRGAVRLGGDTDSCAAITGAFAGTWYGYDGIPELWLRDLERASYLQELESKLSMSRYLEE